MSPTGPVPDDSVQGHDPPNTLTKFDRRRRADTQDLGAPLDLSFLSGFNGTDDGMDVDGMDVDDLGPVEAAAEALFGDLDAL
jgi:hypothetical protein